MPTGIMTRGRSLFTALLIVVLTAGLINSIGWAQDATPDVDTLDEICATLAASPDASPETSPDASPVIGTPESAAAGTDSAAASPESGLGIASSPAAAIEAELCGTPAV